MTPRPHGLRGPPPGPPRARPPRARPPPTAAAAPSSPRAGGVSPMGGGAPEAHREGTYKGAGVFLVGGTHWTCGKWSKPLIPRPFSRVPDVEWHASTAGGRRAELKPARAAKRALDSGTARWPKPARANPKQNPASLKMGVMPYKCKHCDVLFAQSSNCAKHQRRCTGQRTPTCAE